MRSNAQIAARFSATEQDETGRLVLREIALGVGFVDGSGDQLSRATEAATLAAGRRE